MYSIVSSQWLLVTWSAKEIHFSNGRTSVIFQKANFDIFFVWAMTEITGLSLSKVKSTHIRDFSIVSRTDGEC